MIAQKETIEGTTSCTVPWPGSLYTSRIKTINHSSGHSLLFLPWQSRSRQI